MSRPPRPASTSVRRYSRMNRSSPVKSGCRPSARSRSAIPASDTATGQPSVRSSSSAVAVGESVTPDRASTCAVSSGPRDSSATPSSSRSPAARSRAIGRRGRARDVTPTRHVVGQPVDDVGQHVEARRRGDLLHAVDEQRARRAGCEGLHEARDGDDARSRAGGPPERGQQRGGVVVGVGARVPHRRAGQPVRPLAAGPRTCRTRDRRRWRRPARADATSASTSSPRATSPTPARCRRTTECAELRGIAELVRNDG